MSIGEWLYMLPMGVKAIVGLFAALGFVWFLLAAAVMGDASEGGPE